MVRYKSRDNKIVDFVKDAKERGKATNLQKSRSWKKIAAYIMAGTLAIGIPAAKEINEVKDMKTIEQNASIETAFRSFKNIDKENMGMYLSNQIKVLYEKYPDLDEMIFKKADKTTTDEFIKDMYTLYKAFLVDKSEKEIENIKDVKVTAVDKILITSDRLTDGQKKLMETHKEQYKHITDKYIAANEKTRDGANLANEIYELLALEVGLEKNAVTSKQMAKEIEEKGFYYDEQNNKFYTKDGPATLTPDIQEEKMQDNEVELDL